MRRMREIVRSGELGRVRAMNTWAAREWMLAPRRPEELEVALGGGRDSVLMNELWRFGKRRTRSTASGWWAAE